ncbi:cytochrome P450 CYP736A12-like protein [Tripterygium wilfordii]|uniref:Cytochrome P450 CYP736A12-like protein n=1 Tax=Tripterygium wilfordii TaxID=458696 RepID=A0A7J7C8A7_TRIWF|nr:cytochrome P450 CYP736A12-like [Tripterygium wilfordii]KAF5730373.1 cytochrome P450 CYP736A12-like protein [Tripterygium wilfordii]
MPCPLAYAHMSPSVLASTAILLGCLWLYAYYKSNHDHGKLPPGPRALPFLGSLHMLGNLPHLTLAKLAQKYGPLMSIKLGSATAIVISSPDYAELFLKTHDPVFASRPDAEAAMYLSYGGKGMALTPYGSNWRNARKLCHTNLLCASKVESSTQIRREELEMFVGSVRKSAMAQEVVDLTEKVRELIENMIFRMLFGHKIDYHRFDVKMLIEEASFFAGAFNISDFMPYLGALDLQGMKQRMGAFSKAMDEFLEKIISDHEQDPQRDQNQHGSSFIDVLLSSMNKPLMNPNDRKQSEYIIDRDSIKAIIIDMFIGGYDSTATSIMWAISELFMHPRVMKCLQQELQNVVGTKRMVEETDLPKLTYLDMVLNESFRLHPSAPLLSPREAMEDIKINKYYIPKKSRIVLNTWAIGRDVSAWSSNVNEFLPERFMEDNVDVRGRDFRVLPFGSGRRGCPAINLGLTITRLVVAQLMHCFNWELPEGMSPSDLDLSEKCRLSFPRVARVHAVPTSYRIMCE